MEGFVLFFLLMGLLAVVTRAGYILGRDAEQEELQTQRQVLDAEWHALERNRRVNDVFFHARDAMRHAEADATSQERRRLP
jgi:hypothetical protein